MVAQLPGWLTEPLGLLLLIIFLSTAAAGGIAVLNRLISGSSSPSLDSPTAAQTMRSEIALGAMLALVGVTAGYLGGLSREPAVGEIVPAALALIGAAVTYTLAQQTPGGPAAAKGAAALALGLSLGYGAGSQLRSPYDHAEALKVQCLTAMTDPKVLKDDAAYARLHDTFGAMCVAVIASSNAMLKADDPSRIQAAYADQRDQLSQIIRWHASRARQAD